MASRQPESIEEFDDIVIGWDERGCAIRGERLSKWLYESAKETWLNLSKDTQHCVRLLSRKDDPNTGELTRDILNGPPANP